MPSASKRVEKLRRTGFSPGFSHISEKGRLHRVGQACQRILVRGRRQSVDKEQAAAGVGRLAVGRGDKLFYLLKVAVGVHHARVTGLEVDVELGDEAALLRHRDGGGDSDARALGESLHRCHDILHALPAHLLAGDGRAGAADTPEEQTHIVVYLSGCADGRARVARVHLLLDGDGRRQTADVVALGLVHTSQKLAGVGAEALDIAALALGVEGVESQ